MLSGYNLSLPLKKEKCHVNLSRYDNFNDDFIKPNHAIEKSKASKLKIIQISLAKICILSICGGKLKCKKNKNYIISCNQ